MGKDNCYFYTSQVGFSLSFEVLYGISLKTYFIILNFLTPPPSYITMYKGAFVAEFAQLVEQAISRPH